MNHPLISIIIPNYNRENLISKTLNSVINQTYTNWECIVVDDHSTDNSIEVVKKYSKKDSRVKILKRPSHLPKGANACRNYGFEVSKGEYINWFDSDDIMCTNFISEKVSYFDNDKLHVCFCSYYISNEEMTHIKANIFPKTDNFFRDYLLWNLRLLTPSPLFRRTFLENKSLFSTQLSRGQETEFFSRIFSNVQSDEIKIINTPLFYYIQHKDTKSSGVIYNKKHTLSRLYIYKSLIERFSHDKELFNKYYKDLHFLLINAVINKDYQSAKTIKDYITILNKKRGSTRSNLFKIEYFIVNNIPRTKTFILNRWGKL